MNEENLNTLTYRNLVRQAYRAGFTDEELDAIFKAADDLYEAGNKISGEQKQKEAMKKLIRQMLERRRMSGGGRYRKRKSKKRKSKKRKSKKKKSKTRRRRR